MTKKDQLLKRINRQNGVGLDAAAKSLAWQPHTVRAAISRLKQAGHLVRRTKTTKGWRYVMAEAEASLEDRA